VGTCGFLILQLRLHVLLTACKCRSWYRHCRNCLKLQGQAFRAGCLSAYAFRHHFQLAAAAAAAAAAGSSPEQLPFVTQDPLQWMGGQGELLVQAVTLLLVVPLTTGQSAPH